jgi:hypothetical protein
MNAAQVVPKGVKVNGGFQMREFLTKSIGQSSEAAEVHSDIQVGAFDVAGADMSQIGIPADWGWDRLDDLGRAVPVRSRVVGLPVDLVIINLTAVGLSPTISER